MFSSKSTFTGCWVGGWIIVGMAEDCLGLCLAIKYYSTIFSRSKNKHSWNSGGKEPLGETNLDMSRESNML